MKFYLEIHTDPNDYDLENDLFEYLLDDNAKLYLENIIADEIKDMMLWNNLKIKVNINRL